MAADVTGAGHRTGFGAGCIGGDSSELVTQGGQSFCVGQAAGCTGISGIAILGASGSHRDRLVSMAQCGNNTVVCHIAASLTGMYGVAFSFTSRSDDNRFVVVA